MFNWIWDQAGPPRPTGGTPPRPYDFRYDFADANIERWMAGGIDVTAMLPYLSAYMGTRPSSRPTTTSTPHPAS